MRNFIKPIGFILIFLSLISIITFLPKQFQLVSANGMPDLAIIDVYWQPENPVGETKIQLFVVIKNVGDAEVTMPFAVDLTVRDIEVRWWIGRADLPVKPGNGFICPTKEIPFAPGNYEVIAEVDKDKRVTDANRENNKMKKTLIVTSETITRTITETTATVSLTTITKTATTSRIIVNKIDYPEKVEPGETFKVLVVIDYEFPDLTRIRVEISEKYTNRIITFVDTENTRYIGKGTFELWLTSPKENIIWDLVIKIYSKSELGGGFYYVTHRDISIMVGIVKTTTTTITTSFIWTTETTKTESPTLPAIISGGGIGIEPWIAIIVGGLSIIAIGLAYSLRKKKALPKPSTVVICKYCGKELPLDAEYCSECGKKVK